MAFWGIDAISIYNVEMLGYDLLYLRKQSNKGRQEDLAVYLGDITDEKKCQYTIKIIDEKLAIEFTHNFKIEKGRKIWYTHLSVATPKDVDNSIPKSIIQLNEHLNRAVDQINERHGVTLDISKSKIKSIELNVTMQLANPYSQYNNVFQFMIRNARGRYISGQANWKVKDESSKTYYLANDSIGVKIYNKYLLGSEGCRIEYTLKSRNAVEYHLKTTELDKLTDYQVCEFIKKRIEGNFQKPCIRAIQEQNKYIIRQLKSSNKKGIQTALKVLVEVMDQDYIFDIVQFHEALKRWDKKNNDKILKALKHIDTNNLYGNKQGLEEILGKALDRPK